ncbi:MAG: hypothetical protein JWR55_1155 [Aeromicrobium sp.]|nr:hypothetical protein [Aeromicrobium sp.]
MTDRPQYPSYPGDDTPGGPPAPDAEPGYGQAPPPPGYGQAPPPGYGYPPPHRPTSAKAVTGMVLGIVSIFFCYLGVLIGPAAIIVSVLASKDIKAQPPGAVPGKGMATAGLVTGIIGTLIWAAIIAVIVVATLAEQ